MRLKTPILYTKYISVQTLISAETGDNHKNLLTNMKPEELCRFINGEIYQATAILGQIRTQMDDFNVNLKIWQQLLFQSGGDLYKSEGFRINGREIAFLEKWLEEIKSIVKQPEEFVLPGGHPLNPLFHQVCSLATQAERWFVQTSRLMPLSHGVRTVLYLTSHLAFLLSVYVNQKHGYEHEFVYDGTI